MAEVMEFTGKYRLTIEAACYERFLAECEYETVRNMPVDEHMNCIPLPDLDRFRAARERLHKAQDNAWEARFADLRLKLYY